MNQEHTIERVAQAMAGTQPIDESFVAAVGEIIGAPSETVQLALRAALRANEQPVPSLEMRTAGWKLDLNAAILKSVSTATLTTATLSVMGADSVPATVLSIIAPFLFEIDRIEVEAEDFWVHAHLVEVVDANDVTRMSDLYDRLPSEVREELTVREFAGVVERLQEARLLTLQNGGIQVRSSSRKSQFWLSLR